MPHRLSEIDWDDLKFFLAVARSGTLRGAADLLQANHATVSRRLMALEQAINARLFDRSKGGLQLTQLGEELLPRARRVEEEINAASRLVTGRDTQPAGPIHLSMPPFLARSAVPQDLAEFGQLYPDIDLHVQLSNDFVDLGRREADVTIRIAYEVTDDVVGRRVLSYAKGVYCSPDIAAHMKDNKGEGLAWIGWAEEEGTITAPWIKSSPFPKATIRHRINDGILQMECAAAGMGLAYLPCFMGDRDPRLIRAPFQTPVIDRSIWLLLHSDLRKTARIRLFVDFLVERLKARKHEFSAGIS